MRRLKVGPAFHNPPARDPPDYDAAERKPFPALRIRRRPAIPHHHFVIFRDHILDLYMQIGKSLQRAAHILNSTRRPRRHSRRHIRSVIYKVRREVHIPDLYVFPVDELLEVVPDKFPRFFVRHSGFGVDRFHGESLQAFAA
jgi:hypothetical protein